MERKTDPSFLRKIILVIVLAIAVTGTTTAQENGNYASVNGLKMYYEIHGSGKPLVLLHGGGSTIDTSFGRILPSFARTRQVIAIELQAHGHTADRDRPLSFEQDADDVAALLRHLKISNADIMGFSNGGCTTLQVAIRHPELVHKLIVASAMYKRDGLYPQVWEALNHASLENMPAPLKNAYLKAAPDPKHLQVFQDKCRDRMLEFKGWRPEDIQSILAPALILIGDADIIRPEHAVEMYRLIPHSRLAVLPGGHGDFIGEITVAKEGSKIPEFTVSMIEEFLDAPMP